MGGVEACGCVWVDCLDVWVVVRWVQQGHAAGRRFAFCCQAVATCLCEESSSTYPPGADTWCCCWSDHGLGRA